MRQAVILVGGLGTRLRSLGLDCPKPMVPVDGVPFVRHVIREFARFGIEEILLVAGYKGSMVASVFDGEKIDGAEIKVLIEPEPRGTAGALDFVKAYLDPQFVMANGDTLFITDLAKFLAEDLRPTINGRLLTRVVPDASRYGSVEIDPDGRILAFVEKRADAGEQAISAGICVLRAEALDGAVTSLPCSLEVDIFPKWVAQHRMEAVRGAGYFIDIGIPDSYHQACKEIPSLVRRPAVFLSRTLIVDPRLGRLLPGALEAVAAINESGRYVVVIAETDRRGDNSLEINRAIQNDLMYGGAHVDVFCSVTSEILNNQGASAVMNDIIKDWPILCEGSFLVSAKDEAIRFASSIAIDCRQVEESGRLTEIVRAAINEFQIPFISN